jgi:recombination protein RecT
MTTEIVETQAKPLAKATVKNLLTGDAFKAQIANALPKHLSPERFIRVALTALTRTPALADCTQASLFQCLLDLSAMGLEPDGRRAHLIPFRDHRNNTTTCTLVVDYKGIVELALRSGVIANIHADSICENDTFDYDRGEIKSHRIDFRRPRGEAYAYYCLVRFKDGTEKAEVMTIADIDGIRKRSKSGNSTSSPWSTDYSEMAKKTVFKRASKWLTLSPEIREKIERDDDLILQPVSSATAKRPVFDVSADILFNSESVHGDDNIPMAPLPSAKKK